MVDPKNLDFTVDLDFLDEALKDIHVQSAPKTKKRDPGGIEQNGYWLAAAVMHTFESKKLIPIKTKSESRYSKRHLINELSIKSVFQASGDKKSYVRSLTDRSRKHALRTLKTAKKMREARESNPDVVAKDDVIQWAIDTWISKKRSVQEDLNTDQIVALLTVSDWFEGLFKPKHIPSLEKLHNLLSKKRAIAPFELLVGDNYLEREEENLLNDFIINGNTQRNPLFIFAPGGMGKSTLLAKLVLDHAFNTKDPIPFTYIDCDRSSINLSSPIWFLEEVARQLKSQFQKADFSKLLKEIHYIGSSSSSNNLESVTPQSDSFIFSEFGDAYARILDEKPFLFIIDTFEVVQKIDPILEAAYINFFKTLSEYLPNLRVVLSGRSRPVHIALEDVKLLELKTIDKNISENFLRTRFEQLGIQLDEKEFRELCNNVHRLPLILRLAVDLINKSSKDVQGFDWVQFNKQMDEKTQISYIYERIVSHIANPELRKLVYPGLCVRRITIEVIEHILAGICDISLKNSSASELYNDLKKEVDLIEVRDEATLIHPQSLRENVLPDLDRRFSKQVKKINENALLFYSKFDDLESKAEAFYHRIRLSKNIANLDRYWEDEFKVFLQNAVGDLSGEARDYLSRKLGGFISVDERKKLVQENWEDVTIQNVRTYLSQGNFLKALERLNERLDRSPASELYRLEAQALMQSRQYEEAAKVIQRGLESAEKVNENEEMALLYLLNTRIEELNGDIFEALKVSENAIRTLKGNQTMRLELLEAQTLQHRLLGRVGDFSKQESLNAEVLPLIDQELIRNLEERPSLAAEMAAEFGQHNKGLLRLGLHSSGEAWEDNDDLSADQVSRVSRVVKGRGQQSIADSDYMLQAHETTLNNFTRKELEMLLRFEFGISLDKITGSDETMSAQIYNLIQYMDRRGQMGMFVDTLLRSRPTNKDINKLAVSQGIVSAHAESMNSSIAFIQQVRMLENKICLVQSPSFVTTGFLIGPDMVMTALPLGFGHDSEIVFRFDFQRDTKGFIVNDGIFARLHPNDPVLFNSESTNLAIFRLEKDLGGQKTTETGDRVRGWINIERQKSKKLSRNKPIVIAHIPANGNVSISNGTITRSTFYEFHHDAATVRGSTGAPIFDNDFNCIGVHIGKDDANSFAISIHSIVEALGKRRFRSLSKHSLDLGIKFSDFMSRF